MESREEPHIRGPGAPGDRVQADPAASAVDQGTAPVTPPTPPTGVPPSRAGRLWMALAPAMVFLVVILVFVFQNLHNVKISFFTASGSFPLALAVLLAALLGALIVLLLGSIRILQLRRIVRHRSQLPRSSTKEQP